MPEMFLAVYVNHQTKLYLIAELCTEYYESDIIYIQEALFYNDL